MRIIIETDRLDGVSVSQDLAAEGHTAPGITSGASTAATPEAIDGGGPPDHLLGLLTGEPAEEPDDAEDGAARSPDDGGGVPAWLVEVIEGSEGASRDSEASELDKTY